MLRILLQYILPLLLPFLVYAAYVALARGRLAGWTEDLPWPALLGAGVLLMAASLVTWSLMSGAPADRTYVPPRLEGDRVVPAETLDQP